jgi:hypothetical protein
MFNLSLDALIELLIRYRVERKRVRRKREENRKKIIHLDCSLQDGYERSGQKQLYILLTK